MSTHRDRLAKLVLEEVLEPYGTAQREVELDPGYLPRADFLFTPAQPPPGGPWPGYLQLLGEMVGALALFEFCSHTPDQEMVLDFLAKQMSLRTRRRQQREQPTMAHLWILCAGRPHKALAAMDAQPDRAYGAGFYGLAPWARTHLVVLPELPRTRQTLVLRLLGAPRLRQEALRDIAAIPDADGEQDALFSMVAALRHAIAHDTFIPTEEKESFMTAARQEVERLKAEWKNEGLSQGLSQGLKQGLSQGLKQGLSQGLADALLRVLARRGVLVDEPSRERILACQDLATLQTWTDRAVTATALADVFG